MNTPATWKARDGAWTRAGTRTCAVALAALALGAASCSSASSGGFQGGVDAGPADAGGAGPDTGTAVDAAAPADAAGHDAGSAEGEDAETCGEPQTALGPACDGCVAQNCEPVWCSCAVGPAGPGAVDSGGGGCLGYVSCVEDCVADDAGSPTDCFQPICATPAYTTIEQQAGHAYLDCMVQYCASDCGK